MSEELYVPDIQSPEHRAGAWVVLLVGVLGMGFGLFHWRSNIVDAFATNAPKYKTTEQIEQERLESLKSKDTDTDGLNDFEESYVFKTSPYLSDSDSDGKSDRDELTAGSDPGCPEGRECGPLGQGAVVVSAGAEDATPPNYDDIERLQNLSPAEVRALLIESGVAAKELEGIDDATLMSIYRQSLLEAQGNGTSETQDTAAPQETTATQEPPATSQPAPPTRPPAPEGDEEKEGEEN